ncbi:Alpha/Beta hydrolase protein [Gorgonomyces haynaldii]|nr:Alpha/Beta hydrolase protein [Gorgonomyces haynaldii]
MPTALFKTSILKSTFIRAALSIDLPEPTHEKSGLRRELLNRFESNVIAPLPTWETLPAAAIKALRIGLEQMRGNVNFGQQLTTGVIATTPTPLNVSIQKVMIPVPQDLEIDGKSSKGSPDLEAEWVEFKSKGMNQKAERVILYLHGGAYVVSSRRTHRTITWRLSKYADCRLLVIDYRLAPKHTYPSAIFDALAAYQYLVNPPDPSLPKYDPSQISFCGDSAGGGLSLATMLYLRDTGYLPLPSCVGCFSPWADLTQSMPAWHLNKPYCYLPSQIADPSYISKSRSNLYVDHDEQLHLPYVSPCFSKETSTPIPPTLIQCGGAERVRDDSIYFSEIAFPNSPIRLEIYSEMVHMFQLFSPFFKFSKLSVMRMGHFLKEHMSSKKTIKRESLYIKNEHGFPVEETTDAKHILLDGMEMLIERGIWESRVQDGKVVIQEKE